MGITDVRPAGFNHPGECIFCGTKGELRRLRCSNGTFQYKLYCPSCNNCVSSAISKAQVKEWGFELESLPIHEPDTEQRPPSVWDARPDCPTCQTPCILAVDDRQNDRPVWVCNDCGWSGGTVDKRLYEAHMGFSRGRKLSVIRLRALARRNYSEYLLTEHWRRIRWSRLWMANAACELCLSGDELQVHHKTYSRLAEERPEDLIVLCRRCHEHFHAMISQSDLEEDEDAF